MKFSANFENLYPMLDWIGVIFKEKGYSEKQVEEVRLAIEEVLTNIINYAYNPQEGDVEILCHPVNHEVNGLAITIQDHGKPFDPLSYASTHPVSVQKSKGIDQPIGGHGISLYQSLMDKVVYQRTGGTNVLILTKYLKR